MTIRYPNGKKYVADTKAAAMKQTPLRDSYSNRGMTLEEDLNETNTFYLERGLAVIHKKPTPVQIVQVDYPRRSAAVIKEAYFKQASTTDYNGVYRGKYVDFEAKETRNATSFPLKNFHKHQIAHMENVEKQEGISFVIIRFTLTEEIFYLPASRLFDFWNRMENGGRKSITKAEIESSGFSIPTGLHPRIPYLSVIDKLYF
ncbi:Holliday junction resolvase RecU [Bacillus badius]|uniref:Holliday junction resolvase RecU n=1 Tax=Bacillus badius TaxID=1455 RepID=A0ABR5B064_BACBA|nr:Holliday junction resolvase RecU [Bacillus badius]KIL75094.1 RecU Holliday junction resolvase [Bacillus badius]KIL79923.1 RecU Holliday junction resolvase [Bacillus badius]KZN99003.1 Holliday junction resolvase RecU [Bacillus badius]MED0664942.1 Holliday junction resolvase RecU [Bacillus badius]MED4715005.1 Holliday junction resolvase RecU [Bacillus badius]